jgi:hypothetical protein
MYRRLFDRRYHATSRCSEFRKQVGKRRGGLALNNSRQTAVNFKMVMSAPYARQVPHRVESNHLACLTVRIHEFEAEAFADPGASYTFVRLDEICRREPIKGKRPDTQPTHLGPIQSTNCGYQQCVGQFQAYTKFSSQSTITTFYVANQQPVPILICYSFLRPNRAIWGFCAG